MSRHVSYANRTRSREINHLGSLNRCQYLKGPAKVSPWTFSFLPKVGEYGTILVVVDKFSKYATFIPAPINYSVEEIAYLFMKNVVKY